MASGHDDVGDDILIINLIDDQFFTASIWSVLIKKFEFHKLSSCFQDSSESLRALEALMTEFFDGRTSNERKRQIGESPVYVFGNSLICSV